MPGDPRIERTLRNLDAIIENPSGWSPSTTHAWQGIAAEAKRVIEALDELGPDSAIEQGISRLEMLRVLRGEGGDRTLRYRGHRFDVDVNPLDGIVIVRMTYTERDGTAAAVVLIGEADDHARAVRVLREIDITIDAVLAVNPLRAAEADLAQSIATSPTFAREWLDRHDDDVRAATVDQVIGILQQFADQTEHVYDIPANTIIWDVIDRVQKLRPVDVPTEQDRAEAEADDEREGKAAARAEEVQTDDE